MSRLSCSPELSKTIEALSARGFRAFVCSDKDEAKSVILDVIPSGCSIGIGDSTTVYQIEIIPVLEAMGHRVVHPFRSKEIDAFSESLRSLLKESLNQDVFITGANAVTETGIIVSMDGVGNRVAGVSFGPRRVIMVVGHNKIVADLDAALRRLEDVICPTHAKHRGFKTPCVEMGKCVDCRVRERICNLLLIMKGRPRMTDVFVVIVEQDLGLGWDPAWPRDRIAKIKNAYEQACWRPVIGFST